MNKTLTALATISLLLAPAALAEGKTYNTQDFSRIKVEAAMNVVHKAGPQTKVVVESSNGDYSDAKIDTDGDTLIVTRESVDKKRGLFSWGNGSLSVSDNGKTVKVNGKKMPVYTVYVTSPDLEGVKASQSSRFESGTIDAGDFEGSVSSSAKMILAGRADTASLSASSSGELKASEFGVGTLKVSASSSGEADVLVNGTGETSVNASSSGEVNLRSAAAARFDVNASSGASIDMAGACSTMAVSASSGADVDADDLRCVDVTVNASSGGDVEAYASGSAKARASSGGDVSISGKPGVQDGSKSSGGSVSFSR